MKEDNVWHFVLGIAVGMIIGALIVHFSMGLKTKFCPTCGEMYTDSVYCEYDGTLLKERGN